MNETVSKHRKKLNAEQLEVLELLHKFRFGSNNLFAQYFDKKDRSFVFKRLSILLEQGLIGKRFEPSYRLQGKPAAYYLTPTGARMLEAAAPTKDTTSNMTSNDAVAFRSRVNKPYKMVIAHTQKGRVLAK